jgi:hypothetical protein
MDKVNHGELANSEQSQAQAQVAVPAGHQKPVPEARIEAGAARLPEAAAGTRALSPAEAGRAAFLAGRDFNDVYDSQPATPTRGRPVEVDVVGRRCVYVNSFRVAGGKPYVSERLPSHTLHTTLGAVLDAFSEQEVFAALAEKKASQEYFAAYHAAKRAASADTRPEGGDAKQAPASLSGAVGEAETPKGGSQ